MGGIQPVPSKSAFNAQFKVGQSVSELPKISNKSEEIFKQMGVTTVNTHFTNEASRLETVVAKAEKNKKWYNKACPVVRSLVATAALAAFVAGCVMGWPLAAILVPLAVFGVMGTIQAVKERSAIRGFFGSPLFPILDMVRDYKEFRAFAKDQKEVTSQMQKMSESIDESYAKLKGKVEEEIGKLDKIDVRSISLNEQIAKTRAEYKTSLAELEKCKEFYAKFKEAK